MPGWLLLLLPEKKLKFPQLHFQSEHCLTRPAAKHQACNSCSTRHVNRHDVSFTNELGARAEFPDSGETKNAPGTE